MSTEPLGQPQIVRDLSVVIGGASEPMQVAVDGSRTLAVGAAEGNDIVLSDSTVSRYHAELERTRDGIHIRDLGSRNGTFVANVRIEAAVVPPGTSIRMGSTTLRVEEGVERKQVAESPAAPIAGLVGGSSAMRRVIAKVHTLAPSRASILIQGETGTGKEVVARAIHDLSPVKDGPFEVVDCGSMPSTLIASELFGHERGAFTGADKRHIGAFERAHGGSIFLDEIGELPMQLQPALLGALERKRFRRVGGTTDVAVDVRVIAATHRDLRAEVNAGTFRADVYYRLAVARINLPALRERPEDIDLLVAHFVQEMAGASLTPFGEDALRALRMHRWSGNVRELRNVIESALAMGNLHLDATASGVGGSANVAGHTGDAPSSYREAKAEAIDRFERVYLTKLIEQHAGNASKAARAAKMDRPYLLSLLRRHGLR